MLLHIDALSHALNFLDAKSLLSVQCANKVLYKLASLNTYWEEIFKVWKKMWELGNLNKIVSRLSGGFPSQNEQIHMVLIPNTFNEMYKDFYLQCCHPSCKVQYVQFNYFIPYKKIIDYIPPLTLFERLDLEVRKKKNQFFNFLYYPTAGGFKQHPNIDETTSDVFSVRLSNTVIDFLKLMFKIDFSLELSQEKYLENQAFPRYIKFMKLLALINEDYFKDIQLTPFPQFNFLVPPLDVEAVWMAHMLKPHSYHKFCNQHFKKLIPHAIQAKQTNQMISEIQNTKKLWNEKYTTSFENPNETEVLMVEGLSPKDVLSYCDWIKNWIKEFKANVHNHIIDYNWLKDYERFLFLIAKYPDQQKNIIPTWTVDLFWHNHMLFPVEYAMDCQKLLGYLLGHVPVPVSKEQKDITDKLWKQEFTNKPKQEFTNELSGENFY